MIAAVLAAAVLAAVPHHDIRVDLDPDTRRIEVTDQFIFEGRDQVAFKLAPWLNLERAQFDKEQIALETDDGLFVVPVSDHKTHRIVLELSGTVPEQGADFAGPEGSYLGGDGEWFLNSGDQLVTYLLNLQVPAGQRIVSSGRLVEEVVGETTYHASFAAEHPSEPPSLFAGPYQVRERQDGDLRLRTYFHPELSELADEYLDAAAPMIARYSEEIGPYPYDDFHIISAPVPVGLGFANLTYVGRRVLPLPFMRGRSLAHEVLHNWWGNGVSIAPGGNWAEGLTTYMADYALSETPQEMRQGWLRDYAALPADRDGPVSDFRGKRHDASQVVGYGKVAFIFDMLRREIGQPAFAAGLRAFWRDQRFKAAGWPELQAAFEQAAGRELAWFFSQWVERAGAPRLEIAAAEVTDQELTLSLRQDAPAYRLTVPLALTTTLGTRLVPLVVEGEETTFHLALDGPLLSLRLDPGFDVFRRLLPGESAPILRDVTLASDTTTLLLSDDEAVRDIATELATRLLDTAPRFGPAAPGKPLLVIGLSDEVAPLVEVLEARAPALPEKGNTPALPARGSARAWTARLADGQPALFVAADDAAALAQLLRPLPHYGAKSYVIFDGRHATQSGLWPTADSPLSRQFAR